jgi:hypothetical protein
MRRGLKSVSKGEGGDKGLKVVGFDGNVGNEEEDDDDEKPLLRKAEVVYNTSLNILNKDIERKGGKDV